MLIVVNSDGSASVYSDPSQPPYDGTDDTLVGVLNNSAGPVPVLPLSSDSNGIFAFDQDGLCTFPNSPPGCPFGPTGYEGPKTSFHVVDNNHGSVVLTGGLPSGSSAYFSLESALQASNVLIGPAGGPLSYSEMIGGWNPCLGCWVAALARDRTSRPVDTYTGAFSHALSDFSVPGHGRSLGLTRSYYAYPDDPTNLGTHISVPNGPLGYGWTFNYNVSLAVTGTSPNRVATVTQETGATTVFKQPASGSTWAPAVPRTIATLVKQAGTWTLTRHATEILNFNASGQLTSLDDLNGYSTTLSYNGSNQLTDVTDPEGRVLHFVWNGTGAGAQISAATILYGTAPARTENFAYDGSGNLQTVTDVGNELWTFGYDTNHRMTTMRNPRLDTVTNHYDVNNRVNWQKDELGRRTCFDYTSVPGGTKVTEPSGVNTCGGSARVDYYNFGMLSNVTRGYGTVDEATWGYGYDQYTLGRNAQVDPLNHASYTSYDASGNVLSFTDPLGRTTTKTYNPQNQVLTSTDPAPLSVQTTFVYDASGINLQSVSRPLTGTNKTATTSYDYANTGGCSAGDVTSMTDPNTKVWSYTCNNHGYHTTTKDPLGDIAGAVYNQDGWLTSSFTPKAGCNTTQNPPSGCSNTYRTQYAHDAFGRVTTTTDPLSHTSVRHYDANGNLDRSTDGVGNTTYTGYSSADEPCWNGVFSTAPSWSGTRCTDAPPAGFHRQTTYNADGTVTAEIDGKGQTTIAYTYDNQKRVKTFFDDVHAAQTYRYNADGTVATLTDNQAPAQVTTYSYDAAAQLARVTYSDGLTPNITSIGYDALGRRTSLADFTGSSRWRYDSLGRLTRYTAATASTEPVSYGYDLKGQQTSVTYPGGLNMSRTFDDAGRMLTVQDWAGHKTTFGHDENGNLSTESFPNASDGSAMQDSFAFDAADRLLNPTPNQPTITYAKAGTSYGSFTYSRDNANRLSSEAATGMPGTLLGSINYTPLSQVQNVQGAAAYSYDPADNPTALAGAASQTYDGANQLCWRSASPQACGSQPPGTGSATRYLYDTRGNRESTLPYSGGVFQGGETCYVYDQRGQLTDALVAGHYCTAFISTASYSYDGLGIRTSKTVDDATTNFVSDPSGSSPLLLREQAQRPFSNSYYIYGPGGTPLERISGTSVLYYHRDQLGSTRAITDASGAVTATYTYDAYGGVSACTGTTVSVSGANICTGTLTVANPFSYSGQYRDDETGYVYLRARYYDPSTGQFTSRDPAVGLTREPYAYTNDNPLNSTDPTGLCNQGDWGCILANIGQLPVAVAQDSNQDNFTPNFQNFAVGMLKPIAQPDYITVQGNFGGIIGGQGGLTYSKSGHLFIDVGANAGTKGTSAYVSLGHVSLESGCRANRDQADQAISGPSFSGGVFSIVGGNFLYNPPTSNGRPSTMNETGVGTFQAGGSYTEAYQVPFFQGPGW